MRGSFPALCPENEALVVITVGCVEALVTSSLPDGCFDAVEVACRAGGVFCLAGGRGW